jgi:hypothetical protein
VRTGDPVHGVERWSKKRVTQKKSETAEQAVTRAVKCAPPMSRGVADTSGCLRVEVKKRRQSSATLQHQFEQTEIVATALGGGESAPRGYRSICFEGHNIGTIRKAVQEWLGLVWCGSAAAGSGGSAASATIAAEEDAWAVAVQAKLGHHVFVGGCELFHRATCLCVVVRGCAWLCVGVQNIPPLDISIHDTPPACVVATYNHVARHHHGVCVTPQSSVTK